jgi:Fatty acid hydroxylase superfamily
LIAGLLGLLGALVYGSFLEWFIHRYFMHTDRLLKVTFQRHAIEHHADRRAFRTFYAQPEENVQYHLVESSFIPILWLMHLPGCVLIGWLTAPMAGVGVALGTLLYTIGYESIHFFIHTPRNYRFQRTRLFRFYCEYHRIHHHKARWNYNIVLPLADVVLRTCSLEVLRPEPSAPEFVRQDTGPVAALRGGP